MTTRYTLNFKKEAVKKFVESGLTYKMFEEHEGIPSSCIHKWHTEFHKPGMLKSMTTTNPHQLSAEEKFSIILETSQLSELELNEYCRKHGYYPEHIKQWKQDFLKANTPKSAKEEASERKADKLKIRKLERELLRKEKALAETAALLVLRKKLDAYWEEDEDS